jgi:hypothetical protein
LEATLSPNRRAIGTARRCHEHQRARSLRSRRAPRGLSRGPQPVTSRDGNTPLRRSTRACSVSRSCLAARAS